MISPHVTTARPSEDQGVPYSFHLFLIPLFFPEDLKVRPGHDTISPLRPRCVTKTLLVCLHTCSAVTGDSEPLYPLIPMPCNSLNESLNEA